MAKGSFRFKQFTINHDRCAMKVGTDGVLLGAWCNVDGVRRVLDIGTGSGLIAVMIAQRNPCCRIDGVEIDTPSYEQAVENAADSPWSDRINIYHACFNEFSKSTEHKYDLIVSNPPFFRDSLASPLPSRTTARHSGSLSTGNLAKGADRLLSAGGRLSIVLPVPESEAFISEARQRDLYCRRTTRVLPNPDKPPKRLLMEFTRDRGTVEESDLVIELDRRHKYSDEFKMLTGDFYLNFLY